MVLFSVAVPRALSVSVVNHDDTHPATIAAHEPLRKRTETQLARDQALAGDVSASQIAGPCSPALAPAPPSEPVVPASWPQRGSAPSSGSARAEPDRSPRSGRC